METFNCNMILNMRQWMMASCVLLLHLCVLTLSLDLMLPYDSVTVVWHTHKLGMASPVLPDRNSAPHPKHTVRPFVIQSIAARARSYTHTNREKSWATLSSTPQMNCFHLLSPGRIRKSTLPTNFQSILSPPKQGSQPQSTTTGLKVLQTDSRRE